MSENSKLPGIPSHRVGQVLAMFADGKTAEEISNQLRIQLVVIESFCPEVKPARTARVRVARVAVQESTGEGDGAADL